MCRRTQAVGERWKLNYHLRIFPTQVTTPCPVPCASAVCRSVCRRELPKKSPYVSPFPVFTLQIRAAPQRISGLTGHRRGSPRTLGLAQSRSSMSSSPPSRVHTVSVTQPHEVPSSSSSGYAATSHPSPPGEGASAGEGECAGEGEYGAEVGGGSGGRVRRRGRRRVAVHGRGRP